MLKSLRITNIVLIENAQIFFSEGFNVLTGETGAGKSAVMQSLGYIAGARSDSGIVRHETDKGSIEAAFDIDGYTSVHQLLTEAGIDYEPGEELIIRRELSRLGKSRAFINNQQAHIHLLRQLGENLLEIVSQHANRRLMRIEAHREILDLFAGITSLKKQFRENWEWECNLKKQLDSLRNSEAERLRTIEICRMELEELDEARIKENEDEELFAEYSRLTNSEELARHAFEIYNSLIEGERPAISILQREQNTFSQLIKFDSSLKPFYEAYQSAILELKEVAHGLRNYHAKIEFNPDKIAEINERLKLINKIKKKYGETTAEIGRYHEKTKQKLYELERSDLQIEELQKSLQNATLKSQELATELTQKRTAAAEKFEIAMKKQLKALNMAKTSFYVSLVPSTRSLHGDETVEFFFAPNIGEKKIAIRECASGGELSRIMLAIQTLLAGKERIPTLVFDEIDANIGGETATVIGEKLREIGGIHQILCITHFPQVAICAEHHIQISKHEKQGRTHTQIALLDAGNRQKELSRMTGDINFSPAIKNDKACENPLKTIIDACG